MTEPNRPGNEKMPDFKELGDRVIAEAPKGPFLVIKTNLDPDYPTEDNPYYENKEQTDNGKFKEYFSD
ncbi:hypothetical protein D1B31_16700 [Neobacillus notoginsengisoli]|uniref:Uncharacterized protein n=1 Tax=Neobacillus notoginsengisoli TaxID=1578198 RepID=A0A417YQ35_9BACI|nr:hypothetical protein [Neobacillus notoginsengisoli]RHW36357.1 hypothetical protein D1B31_16700 [Neobacillus notoginsengisoli]